MLVAIACITSWQAGAVELSLIDVTVERRNGSIPLLVDSRTRFDYDPDSGALSSSGIWYAQNRVGRKRTYTRYAHKVENLEIDAQGRLRFKSYECVEGTLGSLTTASICGNYRFGENSEDDGGLVDDVRLGPPKSLADYDVSLVEWTPGELVVVLTKRELESREVYPELGLTLTFSALEND